jgi:hypothetical protein
MTKGGFISRPVAAMIFLNRLEVNGHGSELSGFFVAWNEGQAQPYVQVFSAAGIGLCGSGAQDRVQPSLPRPITPAQLTGIKPQRNIVQESVSMGTGRLYRFYDNEYVTDIDYTLHEATQSWWGELTFAGRTMIDEEDTFVIELEDSRKSRCRLKKRVNRAVSGIPPRYIYHVMGMSQIE